MGVPKRGESAHDTGYGALSGRRRSVAEAMGGAANCARWVIAAAGRVVGLQPWSLVQRDNFDETTITLG